jgi:hypothetical protein
MQMRPDADVIPLHCEGCGLTVHPGAMRHDVGYLLTWSCPRCARRAVTAARSPRTTGAAMKRPRLTAPVVPARKTLPA